MARFGREFVRAATQPQFAQGLFTAAQQIGAAPRRRAELEAYRNMTPQQQIAYDKAIAKTPQEIQAVQQRERALAQQTRADNAYNAQQKINGLVGQLSGIDPSSPEYKTIENQILTEAEAGGLNTASQQNVLTSLRNQRTSAAERESLNEFINTIVPENLREQARGTSMHRSF